MKKKLITLLLTLYVTASMTAAAYAAPPRFSPPPWAAERPPIPERFMSPVRPP